MTQSWHNFPFNPLLYIEGDDLDQLRATFDEQKIQVPMQLTAIRKREYWAVALPTGVFLNEFRPGVVGFSDDIRARDALLLRIREEYGYQQYRPSRTFVEEEGVLYHHQTLIHLIAKHIDEPAFFKALDVFLRRAQHDPTLIRGKPTPAPFIPPEQRYHMLGHRARGPGWTPEEDQVLRQWFGKRTVGADAGMHVKLTESEWARVLEALDGRRTRASVRQRISKLNAELAAELSVNGYVPRDRLREYMSRALGERPWRPRLAPERRRSRARAPHPEQAASRSGN